MTIEQFEDIAPDDALVLNNYAYLLAQAGVRLGEALLMVERALELSPDNPSYLDTKGWVYYMLEDYQNKEVQEIIAQTVSVLKERFQDKFEDPQV